MKGAAFQWWKLDERLCSTSPLQRSELVYDRERRVAPIFRTSSTLHSDTFWYIFAKSQENFNLKI